MEAGSAPATVADIGKVTAWLRSQGLAVNVVYPGGLIDISGTAGAVADAFHTEIRTVTVNGVRHIANLAAPQVPQALASAVAGIVSLHDFMPRPMFKARPDFDDSAAACSSLIGGCRYVAPPDLATIYNLTPLFRAGITGVGQRIAVIEDSNMIPVFSPPNDWTNFRNNFGLSIYKHGSFVQVHPAPRKGANNCANPGAATNGDYVEASIDAEWASAAAPNAQIQAGILQDHQDDVRGLYRARQPDQRGGPAAHRQPQLRRLRGGARGGGEQGAERALPAGGGRGHLRLRRRRRFRADSLRCDRDRQCQRGDARNRGQWLGLVALCRGGGRHRFRRCVLGQVGHLLECGEWQDRRIGPVLYPGNAVEHLMRQHDADSLVSRPRDRRVRALRRQWLVPGRHIGQLHQRRRRRPPPAAAPAAAPPASSAKAGIVGGSMPRGYAKPAWQKIAGNPADGMRDVPDVAMFAGSLTWGHIYVVCANKLGTNVSNCNKTYPASLLKAGGTSFGAPIMAGIQALVNQKTKKNWGNPDPVYYQLARTGPGTGKPDCNATLGNKVGATCIFHDVTMGDNDVHCSGTIDCFGTPPSGEEFGGGVLSTVEHRLSPGVPRGQRVGFRLGPGLPVNAARLVEAWPGPVDQLDRTQVLREIH